MVVERAELGEVPIRLLEVIAEDLLVLGRALAVDAVGPLDELLVKRRAGALEDSVVGGVPDEDVVEAIRLFFGGSVGVGQNELLVRERLELCSDPRSSDLGSQVAHGVRNEGLPDDRGWLDRCALVCREAVEPGGEKCLDRRRHRNALDVRGRVPASVTRSG